MELLADEHRALLVSTRAALMASYETIIIPFPSSCPSLRCRSDQYRPSHARTHANPISPPISQHSHSFQQLLTSALS